MSSDAGYMLIRVDLQGAREAAAEAAVLSGEIKGVGTAAATSGAASAASASKTSRMRTAWSGVAKAAKVGALGLVGLGAGIGMAAKAGIDETLELSKVAVGLNRNLGISSREGTQWGAVAKARGIDTKALTMAFTTMSKQMVASNKDWTMADDTFKQLGITQEQVAAGLKDGGFPDFINELADALGRANGSAERQAAAAKLLGRGYQTVLPMFAEGSKGLQEQLDLADKYHVSFGGQMVKDNMRLVQAQRESTIAWMGIKASLSEAFLPAVMDAHKEFQDFAEVITDPKLSREEKISYVGDKIKHVLQQVGRMVRDAIPEIANYAGHAAPKVVGAFITGFLEADNWGKLALGTWLFLKLGGKALLAQAVKWGGLVALSFGKAFITRAVAVIAGPQMVAALGTRGAVAAALRPAFAALGTLLGPVFALAFVVVALKEISNTDWADMVPGGESFSGQVQGAVGLEAANNALDIANGALDQVGGRGGGGGGGKHRAPTRAGTPKRVGPLGRTTSYTPPDDAGGNPSVTAADDPGQPIILMVDGKKMAEVVAKRSGDAAARR